MKLISSTGQGAALALQRNIRITDSNFDNIKSGLTPLFSLTKVILTVSSETMNHESKKRRPIPLLYGKS